VRAERHRREQVALMREEVELGAERIGIGGRRRRADSCRPRLHFLNVESPRTV
jgi:hypothetical protein